MKDIPYLDEELADIGTNIIRILTTERSISIAIWKNKNKNMNPISLQEKVIMVNKQDLLQFFQGSGIGKMEDNL